MAKKKTKEPSVPRADWTREEMVSLLAWLDHTLMHKSIDFKSTVTEQLENKYAWSQVERKLWTLWNGYGLHQPADSDRTLRQWRDEQGILVRGSSSLSLDLDFEDAISVAVQLLEDEYLARQLVVTPERRLRSHSAISSSRSWVKEVQCEQQKKASRALSRSTTANADKFSKETQANASRSLLKRDDSHLESSPAKSRAKRMRPTVALENANHSIPSIVMPSPPLAIPADSVKTDSEPCTALQTPTIKDTDDSDSLSSVPEQFQRAPPNVDKKTKPFAKMRNDRSENLSIGECSHLGRESRSTPSEDGAECHNCHLRDEIIGLQYWCKECMLAEKTTEPVLSSLAPIENPMQNPCLQSAIAEIEVLRMQLAEKVEELKENREDISRKESDISNLTLARDTGGTSDLEKCIADQRKKLESMEDLIRRREKFGVFTTLSVKSNDRLGMIKLEGSLQGMFHHVQQIMCGFDGELISIVPASEENDELRSLVLNVLGLEASASSLSTFGPQAVIRAFASSALQKWVFETDFPLSYVHSETYPLLDAYRKMILTQDGPLALRNLDLAALSSIFKSNPDFLAEKLPAIATNLAVRLSRSLAPLFSPLPLSTSNVTWDNFATWGQNSNVWHDRKVRLTNMFTASLEIKAGSICNIEDYAFLHFKPGMDYNGKYMSVETKEGMTLPDYPRQYDGRKVGLCVQGAVIATRRIFNSDGRVEDIVVTMENFRSGRRENSRVISKAIVVLADVK